MRIHVDLIDFCSSISDSRKYFTPLGLVSSDVPPICVRVQARVSGRESPESGWLYNPAATVIPQKLPTFNPLSITLIQLSSNSSLLCGGGGLPGGSLKVKQSYTFTLIKPE